MAAQTQCPNCGGYKVGTIRDKVEERELTQPMSIGRWWKGGLGCMIPMAITGYVIVFGLIPGMTFPSFIETGAAYLLMLTYVVFAYWVIETIRSWRRGHVSMSYTVTKIAYSHRCRCDLCGYKWEWVEGTPKPRVTVRPDLIAAGEERQKKAAAAAYLDKQRRARK